MLYVTPAKKKKPEEILNWTWIFYCEELALENYKSTLYAHADLQAHNAMLIELCACLIVISYHFPDVSWQFI